VSTGVGRVSRRDLRFRCFSRRPAESTSAEKERFMPFLSVLFEYPEQDLHGHAVDAPDFFADLNLGQVVDAICAGKEEYDLKPFFYHSLPSIDAIKYRHEVMEDLENADLFARVRAFAEKLRLMRAHLVQAGKLYYKYQKEAWFLDAVEIYCEAVHGFAKDLATATPASRGFGALRSYFSAYVAAPNFISLFAETERIKADLASVKYCALIRGPSVTVRKYESEPDYSRDVEETFARFNQSAVKDYRVEFSEWPDMNHIEAQILEFVALLYPEVFSSLDDYCTKNQNYLDATIAVFDREVQFYIAYLEHLTAFKRAGLQFCYPEVTERKDIFGSEAFDLALAHKLMAENRPVVCNDFYLRGHERIFAVSGPNQGGKTTFARTFGQLHYLAGLGCPVPGKEARLFLFDRLFTHFEREENIANLHGKLQDDLVRIRDILDRATPRSILIMNEILTSTTLQDAIFLSRKILERILELDLLCVWVTFIDEVAGYSEQVVSMVGGTDPRNPASRTFKILRRPADGLAHAVAIAEKYGLTHDRLEERLRA
jgi:DNA mismatch repair protein MutS